MLSSFKSVEIVNHLTANELQKAILGANIIVCRSGYSSIMDLIKLNKHAILIPTPGQTEQEYLGNYLMEKKWFVTCLQGEANLKNLMENYSIFSFNEFPHWNLEMYKLALKKLL